MLRNANIKHFDHFRKAFLKMLPRQCFPRPLAMLAFFFSSERHFKHHLGTCQHLTNDFERTPVTACDPPSLTSIDNARRYPRERPRVSAQRARRRRRGRLLRRPPPDDDALPPFPRRHHLHLPPLWLACGAGEHRRVQAAHESKRIRDLSKVSSYFWLGSYFRANLISVKMILGSQLRTPVLLFSRKPYFHETPQRWFCS